MTAFGYIFIDPEKKFLIPINKQQYMIEEYGRSHGWSVENYIIEKDSSAREPFSHRPQAASLISNCQEEDVIVVSRVDHVFCKARDGLELIQTLGKRNISLHLVDLDGDIVLPQKRKLVISTGISGKVYSLLESLAERERTSHGAAIRRAKYIGRKQGRYLGGPVAFGYQINEDGHLEEDKEQQEIIRRIIALRKQRCSYRNISRILSEKYKTSFSHEGIRKILARHNKNIKK